MDKKKESRVIFIFTIIYLIFFTLLSFIKRNYEFLYYVIILSFLIITIAWYYKKMHLTPIILGSLSILGFMHLGGGSIYISGTRLYDFWIIQGILKYDNIVHALSIFVATLIGYNIVSPHLDLKTKHHPVLFSLLLILIALGIGTMNEIAEFGAVVFFGAQESVGDYHNNALDLVFNLFGSIIACFFIFPYHRKRQINKKVE